MLALAHRLGRNANFEAVAAAHLVGRLADLPTLIPLIGTGGKEEQLVLLRWLGQALTDAAGHIDQLRQRRGGLAEALARMVVTTDGMISALAALSRIMFHVQVLAVNAKIEASQLISTGIDFTVFTREIARLAKCGEQTIGAVRLELAGLRAAAGEALSLQRTFEEKGLPELEAVADRLTASVANVHDRQGRVAQGARDIPVRLRSLFSHIADLVSDLQVYDITRQRLEHVERALTVAADMLEEEDASGMDDRQVAVFVNGIAELQSLQLVHAGDEYHKAVLDVGRSLTAMAEGAPDVGARCEQTFGSGGGCRCSTLSAISSRPVRSSPSLP